MKKLVLSLLAAVVVAGVFFSVKAYAFPHDEMCSVIDDEDPFEFKKHCYDSDKTCSYLLPPREGSEIGSSVTAERAMNKPKEK